MTDRVPEKLVRHPDSPCVCGSALIYGLCCAAPLVPLPQKPEGYRHCPATHPGSGDHCVFDPGHDGCHSDGLHPWDDPVPAEQVNACKYHGNCEGCGAKTCGYCHACADCDMCDCFHNGAGHADTCMYGITESLTESPEQAHDTTTCPERNPNGTHDEGCYTRRVEAERDELRKHYTAAEAQIDRMRHVVQAAVAREQFYEAAGEHDDALDWAVRTYIKEQANG